MLAGRSWFGVTHVVGDRGSSPVQSALGRPPVHAANVEPSTWVMPPMMGWIGIQLETVPPVTWEVVEAVWAVGTPMLGAEVAPVVPWDPPAGFG